MVFSANLQEIEEVCCSGVDRDKVFVRFGGWCWDVSDVEVFGTLDLG